MGITYEVVFSIIGQDLTIGPLVRWLDLGQPVTKKEITEMAPASVEL